MVDKVQQLLEPTVAGLGYELWGLERSRSGQSQLVRIYIDHADGITVDDCEKVSRQVSDVLDVEDAIRGEYTLEVSSPGLDRPLFTLDQHQRFVGQHIRLRLRRLIEGRRRLNGLLLAVKDDAVVVEEEGESYEIPFVDIERSRLEADFD